MVIDEKQAIERNLIDFYLSFKEGESIHYYENEYLQSLHGLWPSFVLTKNNTTNFSLMVDSIKKSNLISKNWILDEDFVTKNKAKIKKAKLFPVKTWTGMLLNSEDIIQQKDISKFKTEKLKDKDISQFVEIVNTTVFKNKRLTDKQIQTKLENKDFHFFVGKYKEQIVSTCLVYNNKSTNGLYFIATKKEFRGKGFGRFIVSKAINQSIKIGQTKFVLHATSMGNSIYKNIGFKQYSKLIIFVKI